DVLRLDPRAVGELHLVRTDQPGLLEEHADALFLERLRTLAGLRVDDLAGSADHGGEVHLHRGDAHAVSRSAAGRRGHLRAGQHGLRRDAAVIVALAAEAVSFRDPHPEPAVASKRERHLGARAPAADHEDVEALHGLQPYSVVSLAWVPWPRTPRFATRCGGCSRPPTRSLSPTWRGRPRCSCRWSRTPSRGSCSRSGRRTFRGIPVRSRSPAGCVRQATPTSWPPRCGSHTRSSASPRTPWTSSAGCRRCRRSPPAPPSCRSSGRSPRAPCSLRTPPRSRRCWSSRFIGCSTWSGPWRGAATTGRT